MSCYSSPENSYTSLSDQEDELPMRVSLPQDGRIALRAQAPISLELGSAEEVSPPRDPILLLIAGPGKLSTTPARVRMSLAEEEWQVSPPQDPEILEATGAGRLATSPIRVREPLDSGYADSFDGEEDQIDRRSPDAPLESIQVLYFFFELDEWRPRRPVISKVLKENKKEATDGVGKEGEEKKQTRDMRSRWRVGLGFFRRKQSRGGKGGDLLPNRFISSARFRIFP